MRVHINQSQQNQLIALVYQTGVEQHTYVDEALRLFLERWEYVLRQDPYSETVETAHYPALSDQDCVVTVDLARSPGNAISAFLTEHLSLSTVSLSYVLRKSLGLLFDGKKVEKKRHI